MSFPISLRVGAPIVYIKLMSKHTTKTLGFGLPPERYCPYYHNLVTTR